VTTAGRRWRRRLEACAPLVPTGITIYLVLKGLHPGLPGLCCPLRALTGVPCPTCYLTRATAASLVGRWQEAVHLHAFGPLAAAALLVWSVQALRTGRLFPLRVQGTHLALTAVALLLYWAGRMVLGVALGRSLFPAA
jgi:hypothetical protein